MKRPKPPCQSAATLPDSSTDFQLLTSFYQLLLHQEKMVHLLGLLCGSRTVCVCGGGGSTSKLQCVCPCHRSIVTARSSFFGTKQHEIRQALKHTLGTQRMHSRRFWFLFLIRWQKRNEILSIRSLVKVFIVPQTCCLQSRLPHCVRAQCQTNIFNAFFCLIKHLSNNSLCSNQHCLHLLVLAGGLPQSICIQSSSVSEEQDRITGGTAFAITQHTIHTTERNLLVLYNASSLETLQGICFFIYRCLHLVITCNLYKDPDTR